LRKNNHITEKKMFKISKVFTLSVIALALMACSDEKGTGWTPDMIPEDVVENDTTSVTDLICL